MASREDAQELDRKETMDILYEISTLLNTGLNKESLEALVGLCELGVNPEALAAAVKDLRTEAARLRSDASEAELRRAWLLLALLALPGLCFWRPGWSQAFVNVPPRKHRQTASSPTTYTHYEHHDLFISPCVFEYPIRSFETSFNFSQGGLPDFYEALEFFHGACAKKEDFPIALVAESPRPWQLLTPAEDSMSEPGHHGPSGSGGIPLHEFRKDVLPWWCPGIPYYPLRLYFERLKLWYRLFKGDDTLVGPMVGGRLQGKAQRQGMNLRLIKPDGTYDVGSAALVRLSVDEVRDPNDPRVILQNSIPSGVQALCNSLKEAFGLSDQEVVNRSIEDFFEFRRGSGNKLSFQEYSVEWDFRLEEAQTKAGLELNDVAKFYLFFRGSALPQKFTEDIKLQLQGDLRRFQDTRTLALRLITKKDDIGNDASFFQDDEAYQNNGWDWYDDGWSWVDESEAYYEDTWTEEPYQDFYDEPTENWQQTEEEQYYGEWPEDGDPESADPAESVNESEAQSYPVKGKGKGKGFSCSICGSRWRSSSSCPVGQGSGHGKSPKGSFKDRGKFNSKGWKGYGYGKKPSFGWKGSGKRPGWGKRGPGYHGYAAKTLSQSFGEMSARAKPVKTVHFRLDQEDEQNTTSGASSSAASRKLTLNFPTALYSDYLNYRTVMGEKRRGLLVDPGASETLRDIVENCLPRGPADVSWCREKQNSVSGISGQPEATLGEVHIPLGFAGADGTFAADVLGGEGSMCPALLSNPAAKEESVHLARLLQQR
ncbi:mzt1 [Symbiodinium sp. KB8]|nr:mzt1 [Symbiodinium sp. KB8]